MILWWTYDDDDDDYDNVMAKLWHRNKTKNKNYTSGFWFPGRSKKNDHLLKLHSPLPPNWMLMLWESGKHIWSGQKDQHWSWGKGGMHFLKMVVFSDDPDPIWWWFYKTLRCVDGDNMTKVTWGILRCRKLNSLSELCKQVSQVSKVCKLVK